MEGFASYQEYEEAVEQIDRVLAGQEQGVSPEDLSVLMDRVIAWEQANPDDLGAYDSDDTFALFSDEE